MELSGRPLAGVVRPSWQSLDPNTPPRHGKIANWIKLWARASRGKLFQGKVLATESCNIPDVVKTELWLMRQQE